MKSMKVLIPVIFVIAMLFPMALLAQEATPEAGTPLSIMQALEIVRAAYGTDVVITEISFYNDAEDDDEFQTACWHFEFADGTELCVDALSGAIVVDGLDAEETPEAEATEDINDDSNDDNGEDVNDDNGEDANDDSEDDSSDDTVLTPLISLEDAIAIALSIYPDSVVTNADLEVLDDGTVVWDIELDNDVRSVDVDANTGAVLDFGYEADDDNGYVEDDSNDDGEDVNDDSEDDSNDDDEDVNDDSEDDDGEDVNDDSEDDSDDDSEDDSNDDSSDDSSDDSNDD